MLVTWVETVLVLMLGEHLLEVELCGVERHVSREQKRSHERLPFTAKPREVSSSRSSSAVKRAMSCLPVKLIRRLPLNGM